MFDSDDRCHLCPHACGAQRALDKVGCCGAGAELRVGRAALHEWEEPPISGTRGSGTVFFSHCSLQCRYCQNMSLSRGAAGKTLTVARLAEIFCELQDQGAHNINLVTPTHYVPHIIAALQQARAAGLTLPIVYNTSGYELPETISLLDGYVDIFLTDFKYWCDDKAASWSNAPHYRSHALAALDRMAELTGESLFDDDGIMQRGVIVRHMLLPGMLEDSRTIVEKLHERYGSRITLSLMGQYTPCYHVDNFPALNTTVPRSDYEALLDFADSLGIENYFWQEEGAAQESFIPCFDGTGV